MFISVSTSFFIEMFYIVYDPDYPTSSGEAT